MSAPKDLSVTIRVGRARDGYAATTELAGNPICNYAPTDEEAARRAQASVLRLLASLVERGQAAVSGVRFKTTDV
jgi:hypothetical protein